MKSEIQIRYRYTVQITLLSSRDTGAVSSSKSRGVAAVLEAGGVVQLGPRGGLLLAGALEKDVATGELPIVDVAGDVDSESETTAARSAPEGAEAVPITGIDAVSA